jgi:hypothetical protein
MPPPVLCCAAAPLQEVAAARTIAERGVVLIGTAHGNNLSNMLRNPELRPLVGGVNAVTLGDEMARKLNLANKVRLGGFICPSYCCRQQTCLRQCTREHPHRCRRHTRVPCCSYQGGVFAVAKEITPMCVSLVLLALGCVVMRICMCVDPNLSAAVLLQTRVERAGAATFVSLLELQSRHT